jgi:hypothetical protein
MAGAGRMSETHAPWTKAVSLAEARRGVKLDLVNDANARAAIARTLNLESLDLLEAEIRLEAWLDGAIITANWRAAIVQICGVSLDPFASTLEGRFMVRVLPPGSPNAPAEPEGEVVIDLDAEDPPDVLATEVVDVGGYVVEHLALEIDPFPRRPDETFEPPAEPTPSSPFDILRGLKRG